MAGLDWWKKILANLVEIKKVKKEGRGIETSKVNDFDEWEIQLRNSKQKHGLGMPKRDPRFAMGSR